MHPSAVPAAELDYYRAHIEEAVRADGVVCLACGARRKSLGHHVRSHGVTLAAYRAEWGYGRRPLTAWDLPPVGPPKPRRRVSPEELAYLRAHWREAVREDGVVCLECGRIFRALPQHVRKHELRIEEYREKWGYNRGSPLMVADLLEWKRQWAVGKGLAAFSPPGIFEKALATLRHARPPVRPEARLNRSDAARALPGGGWRQHNLKVPAETLRALVHAGLTRGEIAARTAMRPLSVWKRLRALGLVAARPIRPSIDAKDAEVLALRQAGLWNSEIAARLGMQAASVSARFERLRRRGVAVPIPARPVPTPRRRVTDDQLLALVRAGRRAAEIAARAGLAKASVPQRLRALRRRGLLPPATRRAWSAPRGRPAVSAQALAYYRAHFLEALQEDAVICLECGVGYRDLANHLRKHGLAVDDYRDQWGYNRGTALITPARHAELRQRALTQDLAALSPRGAIRKALQARWRSKPTVRRETRLHAAAALRRRIAAGWRPSDRLKKLDDETLRTLVEAGRTVREIAGRAGLRPTRVRERLRALGLVAPGLAAVPSRATDGELLALRRGGLWLHEIAARTGLTRSAVGKRLRGLRRRGEVLPPPARRRAAPPRRVSNDMLLALRRAGLWSAAIAARVGVTPGTVNKRLMALRRRGIPVPPPLGPRPNPWRRASDEQLLAHVRAGHVAAEMAARLGIATATVYRRLRSLRARGLLPPARVRPRRAAAPAAAPSA